MDILDIVKNINTVLWGLPIMGLLASFGIVSTIYLGFPQFRKLPSEIKHIFSSNSKERKEGTMSSLQSLTTAIAAQVGTGNIGGISTAILSGGPGSVFWMWVLSILGMSTISVEAILAQKFRTRKDGELVGGPAYYISEGFKLKNLSSLGLVFSSLFAILIVIALGMIGNMVQANSITESIKRAYSLNPVIIGIFISVIAALIFSGGMSRISRFTEFIVPIMAFIYIIGSIIVLVIYKEHIGPVFKSIFKSAFSYSSFMGGTIGYTVKQAMRYGIARGLFSNEAGMGSTPNSHAVADVEHPAKQGFVAMFGVLATLIICTMTALVVLVTEANFSGEEGVGIAMYAFNSAFGMIGQKFLSVAITFFAFSTIIGWYYFGEINIKFLFKSKTSISLYRIFVFSSLLVGSMMRVELVWQLSDLFNALMIIPNIIGLYILLPDAKNIYDDYLLKRQMGNVYFDYKE